MEVMDSLRAALKELILPELDRIKQGNVEINAKLELTQKRLDDITLHLVDLSRRIDAVREELKSEINETNKRIDAVREELRSEINETNKRIDAVREELRSEINETNKRIDALRDEVGSEIRETNKRIDRLYEVIVRRDEHSKIEARVATLERDINELKRRIAA